jgi:hypothetical protein
MRLVDKKIKMKSKVFFFHYNKPASQKAGKPQISVHYGKTCYIVDNVSCDVHVEGKINKRQPYFVMKGKCKTFEVKNNIAVIK